MSGLNYKKLGSTSSRICNTTQLDDDTKCHYAFKNFWGEPCVGKGEIAGCEQFLLFPQCFQKACFPRASKGVILWEWVNNKLCRNFVVWVEVTAEISVFFQPDIF